MPITVVNPLGFNFAPSTATLSALEVDTGFPFTGYLAKDEQIGTFTGTEGGAGDTYTLTIGGMDFNFAVSGGVDWKPSPPGVTFSVEVFLERPFIR